MSNLSHEPWLWWFFDSYRMILAYWLISYWLICLWYQELIYGDICRRNDCNSPISHRFNLNVSPYQENNFLLQSAKTQWNYASGGRNNKNYELRIFAIYEGRILPDLLKSIGIKIIVFSYTLFIWSFLIVQK